MTDRECGSCSECCRALDVLAVESPAGQDCVHQQGEGGGCGIYADRPQGCRPYACLWLEGVLPLDERPDRVGLIVDRGLSILFRLTWGAEAVTVRELREGAVEGEGAGLLRRLTSQGRPVFIRRPSSKVGNLATSQIAINRATVPHVC